MEINVNGTLYPLKASIAFLNEIEKTSTRTISGETMEMGLVNAVISIRDMGDARALADTLMALNVKQTPRLNRTELTEWLEDGDADLEKLGTDVIDFLSKANVCRWKLKKLGILETAKADPEKA